MLTQSLALLPSTEAGSKHSPLITWLVFLTGQPQVLSHPSNPGPIHRPPLPPPPTLITETLQSPRKAQGFRDYHPGTGEKGQPESVTAGVAA